MRVSVVLCTHTLERYDDFLEAVGSVREQTCDDAGLRLVDYRNPEAVGRYHVESGDDRSVKSTVSATFDRSVDISYCFLTCNLAKERSITRSVIMKRVSEQYLSIRFRFSEERHFDLVWEHKIGKINIFEIIGC